MGSLTELARLFGLGGSASPEPITAPPLSSYPSTADAQYAIAQGFGYGTGNEPYIEGKRANIYDRPQTGNLEAAINAPASSVDLTKFKNVDELNKVRTLYAQGALAANRSPIAAYGFDPNRTALQTKLGPSTIGGGYDPKSDRVYTNVAEGEVPYNIVHESTHRGLTRLMNPGEDASEDQKRIATEAASIFKTFPDQETIVRYLMAKKAGDPELGSGDFGDRQRQRSLNYFLGDWTKEQQKRLDRLEELAAEAHKNQRPGGPR